MQKPSAVSFFSSGRFCIENFNSLTGVVTQCRLQKLSANINFICIHFLLIHGNDRVYVQRHNRKIRN